MKYFLINKSGVPEKDIDAYINEEIEDDTLFLTNSKQFDIIIVVFKNYQWEGEIPKEYHWIFEKNAPVFILYETRAFEKRLYKAQLHFGANDIIRGRIRVCSAKEIREYINIAQASIEKNPFDFSIPTSKAGNIILSLKYS